MPQGIGYGPGMDGMGPMGPLGPSSPQQQPQQPQSADPYPLPQGMTGFMQMLNNPASGLNKTFSSGGSQGVYDLWAANPHFSESFGVTLDQVAQALGINPQGGGGSGGPFLDFLMNQMGLAGISQQQPQQNTLGSGADPRRFGPPAPPAPPSLFQSTVGQLGSVDQLLAQLLGGF